MIQSVNKHQGLMRATIDAQEFADVRSRDFMLDDAAQTHLMQLAAARLRSNSVIANATR